MYIYVEMFVGTQTNYMFTLFDRQSCFFIYFKIQFTKSKSNDLIL